MLDERIYFYGTSEVFNNFPYFICLSYLCYLVICELWRLRPYCDLAVEGYYYYYYFFYIFDAGLSKGKSNFI